MHFPRLMNFADEALSELTFNEAPPANDSISSKLWQACQDIARQALQSDYMQGIGNGNLDPDNYGQYVVQDGAYCYNAQHDYQTIVDRATKAGYPELAAFAKARLAGYVKYTQSQLKAWHIADPSALALSQAAQEYIQTEHMAANTLSPIYGVVAMIPCDQLWPWLATQLQSKAGPQNVYSSWITENDTWHGAHRLDNFIDKWFAAHPAEYKWETALFVFKSCMTCELNFFRSACGQSLVPMPDKPAK